MEIRKQAYKGIDVYSVDVNTMLSKVPTVWPPLAGIVEGVKQEPTIVPWLIKPTYDYSRFLTQLQTPARQREHKGAAVYKIKCNDCAALYIGQT